MCSNPHSREVVGGLEHEFYFSNSVDSVVNVSISTDELNDFSEGLGIPPTRNHPYWENDPYMDVAMVCYGYLLRHWYEKHG